MRGPAPRGRRRAGLARRQLAAYRLRAGHLERLTEDHSGVAELVRAGVISEARAEVDERRHLLTQALGSEPRASVTTSSLAVDAGDRYLLCSDGLSGQVPDADIEAVLGEVADPAAAAAELVRRANRAGGVDNVSVIVRRRLPGRDGPLRGPAATGPAPRGPPARDDPHGCDPQRPRGGAAGRRDRRRRRLSAS